MLIILQTTTPAHAITDCSDVYTPLSQSIVDHVNSDKENYASVSNQTGVPWEMLAAIHYRETSFSHTNPSNGQGIFQFANGDGGPYPAGPVDNTEFIRQLTYMANKIQSYYVFKNSPNSALVNPRQLKQNEADVTLIKNTLYSYNGRSPLYANQSTQFGYNQTTQPYEGSPYVMNRFDCPRARMGIITQDYGPIDNVDTKYGAFTLYARLKGDELWRNLQNETSNYTPFIRTYEDGKVYMMGSDNNYYYVTSPGQLSAYGYGTSFKKLLFVDKSYLSGLNLLGDLPNAVRFGTGTDIYVVDGTKKHYYSYATYQSYGSPTVGVMSPYLYYVYIDGEQMATVLKQIDRPEIYSIESGRSRHIGGLSMYLSGNYTLQPSVTLNSYFVSTLMPGAPILEPGTIIKASDTNLMGVIDDGSNSVHIISPVAQKSIGITPYISSNAALSILPKDNQADIGLMTQDSLGNLYLIDGLSKYLIDITYLNNLNKSSLDFVLVNNAFLNRFETKKINGSVLLVRVIGTDPVYMVDNGTLVRVQTYGDFIKAGYEPDNVIDISQNTLDILFDKSNLIFVPKDSLYRVGTTEKVYLQGDDNKSHHITSGNIFNDYGFSYNNVRSINLDTFNSLTVGLPLGNLVSAPDGSIWAIDNRTRHWVSSDLVSSYYLPQNIISVSSAILNPLIISDNLTKFIRINSLPTVFYVNNLTKSPLFSPSTFQSLGGTSWEQVVSVTPSFSEMLSTQPVLH